MNPTLRTLWALLVKNNTQPGLFKALGLLVLLLAAGVYDLFRPVPPGMWFFAFYVVLILAISSGAAAFSVDQKHNAMAFLEYLPVRRWHIWLTNWGDALLWLLAFTTAIIWQRVVRWQPTGAGPELDGVDPLYDLFFTSRGAIVAGVFAMVFCAFAVSAFYRVMTEKESAVILRAIGGSILVIAAVFVAALWVGVLPSLAEVAVPLALIGTIFSIAGLVVFVFPAREWSPLRRWLLIHLPCLILLNGATLGILYWQCTSWTDYRPRLSDTISLRIDRPPGAAPVLYAVVNSRRSGYYAHELDPGTRRWAYLGRSAFSVRSAISDHFAEHDFLDSTGKINLASFSARVKLPFRGRRYIDSAGAEYFVDRWARTSDGQWIVFTARLNAGDDMRSTLFVADAAGQILRQVLVNMHGGFLLSDDARVLARAPMLDDGVDDDIAPAVTEDELVMLDLRSGTQTSFRLPGVCLSIVEDLSAAIVQKYELRDEHWHSTILQVRIPTLDARVLLDDEQLPPIRPREEGAGGFSVPGIRGYRYGTQLALADREVALHVNNLTVCFDSTFAHAAYYRRTEDGIPSSSLMLLDTQSRATRELLGRDALVPPVVPVVRRAGVARGLRVDLRGFSPDGTELRYENAHELRGLSIADGTLRALARRPDGIEYGSWDLSPDGMLVAAEYTVHAAGAGADQHDKSAGAGEPPRYVLQIWRGGQVVFTHESVDRGAAHWLDDARLLLVERRRILQIEVDAEFRVTELFSIPSPR